MDQIPVQPTHYQVLGIIPSIVDSHHDPSAVLKRAYHRALLQNHPDKKAAAGSQPPTTAIYTVDQITTAFTILSSPKDRSAYDNTRRLSRPGGERDGPQTSFQTGVENVDLDDLSYDETTGSWYRSCRCGSDTAYSFRGEDLDGCGEDGELMVPCQDCSLWLRVSFAVVDE